MDNFYTIIRKELDLPKTLNLKKLIGKRVISKGGEVIGKVSQIRINPYHMNLEGVLVKRGIFRKKLYIGKTFFSHLSDDAIILNEELSLFIKGKYVFTSEGERVGKVSKVVRKGNSNELQSLVIKSLFTHEIVIDNSEIKHIGKSVILKTGHNARKKHFWQKP